MSSTDLREIGRRIMSRRKQLGLTQEQLAEKMNVSVQMVSNLERGNKSIRIENLINLCQILNISTDYILLGKETTEDINGIITQMSNLTEKERKMIEHIINYCLTEE